MNIKHVTLAALSTFGLGMIAPAQAQDTRHVSYADLDLSTPSGIAQLDSRISSAVKAVCTSGDPTLRTRMAERRCRREAIDGVGPQRDMALAGKGQVLVINTPKAPRFGR